MKSINEITLNTVYGNKRIAVFSCNILDFDSEIDILTTSAFCRSYYPTPRTMFEALHSVGISVDELAQNPEIDLRDSCNIWLSREVTDSRIPVKRIGCVEMRSFTDYQRERLSVEKRLLASIKAYFQMLDIAATKDIPMETVALPLLGGGVQKISSDLTMIPIINECIEFLKRNPIVKEVYLIEYDAAKAYKFALALEKSYAVYRERSSGTYSSADGKLEDSMAFLSYSSKDRNVADNLCAKLEARGLKVWYAPRNIHSNDYASAIVEAIGKCTHFIVILSKNSMESEHVLNEIDLSFKYMKNIRFLPLRIDSEEMVPAFSYYLSRQHWMEACPPVEIKLEEFVNRVMEEF